MNAMMRIHVRVTSASAAAQIKNLQREMMALTAATVAGAGSMSRFGGPVLRQGLHNLEKYGKNLQWVGRQIEFNFTLPLVLAGAAATKFAFEAEASFIRLQKVYQDAPDGIYTLKQELELLRRGFRALSDEFGVHLDEVNEIGAAWAQAGASGVALAKATRLTLEAMILGDLEAADATEALIAIQAQYELSSADMQQALADLNKISNITTAGFSDLIESLQRGGGIARQAGVTIREFAAMTASIVPAAGNAQRAGSALRTIISRMMAPTNEATEMFRELGLEVDDSAWHSMNFTERLHELKDGLNDVTASQRNMALSVIGSRWQVARLAVLMSDLNNEQGRYATALEGTETAEKSMETYREELEIFLTSTPQGFKILTNQIRNFSIDIIQQVLPALLGLLTRIRDVIRAFTELSPRVQQIVLGGLLLLAVLGTLSRLMGASVLVFVQLAKAVLFVGTVFGGAAKAMAIFLTGSAAMAKTMPHVGKAVLFVRSALVALLMAPFKAIAIAFVALWSGITSGALVLLGALKAIFSGKILLVLASFGKAAFSALLGPWGLAIAAIITLLGLFGDQIGTFISNVADRWGDIPKALAQAMRSAVDVVRKALEAIASMFRSFFGGSKAEIPVPQVAPSDPGRAGGPQRMAKGGTAEGSGNGDTVPALLTPGEHVMTTDAVRKYGRATFEAMNALKFANGGAVPGPLANFLAATGGARARFAAAEIAEQRSIVLEFAPGAGDEFDALVSAITHFKNRAEEVSAAISAQEQVVDRWETTLDEANFALEVASDKLGDLREAANSAQDALNQAQSQLDALVNTPIKGMGKYSDALFENEMAQKRLRLEILRMEEAGGVIEDLQDRLASLSGEIEMLRGKREDLRLAGAGSDVLSTFDSEIKALESQREALMRGEGGSGDSGIEDLQNQMDELQRQAEMLRLEEAIEFDPLRRQIDEVTNSMEEMPFDVLLSKIIAQQNEVARLTREYEDASRAVKDQETVVDNLTDVRDAAQRSYDAERKALQTLQDTYSTLTGQIRDMENALNEFVAAATAAKAAAEAAKSAGAGDVGEISDFAAAAGDFEIPGGTGSVSFEEGDLKKLIEEWEEGIAEAFGNFDLFKPLREQWTKVKNWFRSRFSNFSANIGFTGAWEGVKSAFSSVVNWFRQRLDGWIGNLQPFRDAWDDIGKMLSHWGERIRETFGGEGGAAGAVRTFGNAMEIVGQLVQFAGNQIIGIFNAITLILTGVFLLVWPTIRHVVEQVVGALIEIFGGLWTMFQGFIDFVTGIFTGQWRLVLSGARDFFIGIWDTIVGVLRGAIAIMAAVVAGIVEGIADFFNWLKDILVGNSIIPDMVNAIIKWFQFLVAPIRKVWEAIWSAIKWVWENGIKKVWEALKAYWNTVLKPVINAAKVVFTEVWNAVGRAVQVGWAAVKLVWQALMNFWTGSLKPKIEAIKTVFKDVWESVGSTAKRVWDNTIGKVFDAMKDAIENLPKVFRTARDTISEVWNKIKSVVAAPVRWLAKNVINRLIGAFNTIAGAVPGLPQLDLMVVPQYHEGGAVGEGGTPRNLARHPLRTDEEFAVLRKGERVLTAEERRWYEANDPNAIRHVGGPFDWVGDAANAVGGAASSAGRAALNGIRDIIADVAGPAVRGALSALDGLPIGGWFGKALKGNARAMGDALLKWIDTADDEAEKLTPAFGDIVAVGREIQKMGYHVAEHPAFGGVAPVHTANSYHYRGQAIDVNWYPQEDEPGKLDRLYGWIKSNIEPAMIRELLWRTKGHWGHLHLAMGGGATGWYGPVTGGSGATGSGSGSLTAGGGQTAGGGYLLDAGGLFTRPTTGLFSFAQSASASPEIASPVPLMRSVFRDELTRHGDGDSRTNNFYGDIVLPNIKSGEDADEFVRNLESLGGR